MLHANIRWFYKNLDKQQSVSKNSNNNFDIKWMTSNWNINKAKALYGVDDWGVGYFDVNDSGQLEIKTKIEQKNARVAINDVINGVLARGMDLPVLLRVENLLNSQVSSLYKSFAKAIKTLDYKGGYQGVFPIKVNQQAHVIDEIIRFGKQFNHGLEAGSKAELVIALAKVTRGLIICNGYKDEEFIELALNATKRGVECILVIETPSEIPLIIKQSQRLGIRPQLGVRVKLASKVSGHWNHTSGDRSVFGLSTPQLISLIDQLKAAEMLDCLCLMHYHLGSQIPNIRDIRTGVQEASFYYQGVLNEGANLKYLDLGGGLAVDYDGSRTNADHSRNYGIDEYCMDIVEVIQASITDPQKQPTIVTESGRATVAYSSVLIFDILDVTSFKAQSIPNKVSSDEHEYITSMLEVYDSVSERRAQECYNDAVYYRDELRNLFTRGQVPLRTLALADNIYLNILEKLVELTKGEMKSLPEMESIRQALSDIYYGNFSVFQSLPDSWAIDQVFPIVPLQRLNEKPTRNAIIADITCDSDGKIDRFANRDGCKSTILLHELDLDAEDNYNIGIFLTGAYQETLGDLHNLFGDTNVVSVRIDGDGEFEIVDEIEGDSISDVLSYVEYNPKQLFEQFRKNAEKAVRNGKITVKERKQMVDSYAESLRGYTYFEK